MKSHHRINYIEFPATDLEATKLFYTKTFSWKFTDYGPDYTAFNDGSLDGGFTKDAKAGHGALVVLYSKDLEATKQATQDNGGKILKDIYEFPGGKRFHFADPSGNELAVWSE